MVPDTVSPAADAQARLQDALSFEGSEQEKNVRGFFLQLGIDYGKLTKEEVVTLIRILEKSSLLKRKSGDSNKLTGSTIRQARSVSE